MDLKNRKYQSLLLIFIKSNLNYENLFDNVYQVIGPEKLIRKNNINNLKLQTNTSN